MMSEIVGADVVAVETPPERPDEVLSEETACLGRVVPKRYQEFATGRTCAHQALGMLGFPKSPILIGPSRQPLWPPGAVGSITHCAGYCAAAVARREDYRTIGIDAEPNEPLPQDVLKLVATEEEKAWLHERAGDTVNWDRTIFSAKESVYKAWSHLTGRWLDFQNVRIEFDLKTQSFRPLAKFNDTQTSLLADFDGRYLILDKFILTAVCVQG
jgi:4'-phosphopantetheinyl transferase EntD